MVILIFSWYFNHFGGSGVIDNFKGFWVILVILEFSGVILVILVFSVIFVILIFSRYFDYFGGFRVILILLKVSRLFWSFLRFLRLF